MLGCMPCFALHEMRCAGFQNLYRYAFVPVTSSDVLVCTLCASVRTVTIYY